MKQVLLAEDNEVNQRLIVEMLKTMGFLTEVVGNGREAVDAVGRGHYDLVLMDWRMPEMDGVEATRVIREREQMEGRARMPLIAITANAMPGDRETCLAAGMDAFLSKPLMLDQLREVLREVTAVDDASLPSPPAPDPAAAPPVESFSLDPRALDGIRALQSPGRPSLVRQVIEVYLQSTPPLMKSLRDAVTTRDLSAITMAAHKLKSSSAELGAAALSRLAADLETRSRAGERVTPEALEQLARAFEAAHEALVSIMESEG